MHKIFILLFAIGFMGISSCDVEVDDGNYAEDVAGTYSIASIESNITGYSTLGGSVQLTRVNDLTVDMLIDFDGTVGDLEVDAVVVSDAANDDIDLDKEFSNATGVGFVNGDDLRFKLTYDDGNFIDITAKK